MAIGRPTKKRYFSSGEKLLDALKLSGLTWGSNTMLENHISNNKRWLQLHLPKSSNTLVEDIKHGIPQDRLFGYAKFFGIDPRYFVDDTIPAHAKEFEYEILQKKYKLAENIPFPVLGEDKKFYSSFHEQNGKNKSAKLYNHIKGVYIVYLKEVANNSIVKCATKVYDVDNIFLLVSGFLKYYNVDTYVYGIIFKWSTFIHINYYTQDCAVVGYMIAQDPTCSASILYGKPMMLELFGLAGSFSSTSVPDRFHGYAEKQNIPAGKDIESAYRALCSQVARSSSADQTAREFERIADRIRHQRKRTSAS